MSATRSQEHRRRSEEWTAVAIEAGDFQRYQLAIMHTWLGTLTLLATALVPLFFVLDVIMMPPTLYLRFGIYRAISTVLAVAQLFVVRATRPSRWSFLHGYFISLQVGGIVALMTTSLGGFASTCYAGLNLVVIGVNLLMPWRAYHTAANALLILGIYIALNVLRGQPAELSQVSNNLFFLGATAVIAACINHVRFRLIRREFSLLVDVKGARDALQATTSSLKSLLDMSGQGFLSFGRDFRVGPEYSRECERFLGTGIQGKRIDELLFEDPRQREDFRNGVSLFFSGASRPEVIFDLLDSAYQLKGRSLRAEYKVVDAGRVMIVLTDVTEQIRREAEARVENDRTALLLKVISNRAALGALRRDAEDLFAALPDGEPGDEELVRAIHSFKGDAGFLGFRATQGAAHALEDSMNDALALGQEAGLSEKAAELRRAYSQEIAYVSEALGRSWLERADSVEIPREEYARIEKHVKASCPGDETPRETLESFDRRPLFEMFSRYPELASDLAGRLGKRLSPLVITGGRIPAAREAMEDLVGAFSHIVRNMVDHGIEHPSEREARGKPPEGTLRIDITETPRELVFTFSDDGRGISLKDVRARARQLGLLGDDDTPSPRELLAMIFRDNFSTARKVSMVSGRGVGLCAVRDAVARAGGRITVRSRVGHGTVFAVTVPKGILGQGENAA